MVQTWLIVPLVIVRSWLSLDGSIYWVRSRCVDPSRFRIRHAFRDVARVLLDFICDGSRLRGSLPLPGRFRPDRHEALVSPAIRDVAASFGLCVLYSVFTNSDNALLSKVAV